MTKETSEPWWKRRWEAFLDNAIFWGVGLLATALVTLLAAFGTNDATLPLWLVVLFGLVQLGTVAAVVMLFKRPRGAARLAGIEATAKPNRHAQLLARLRALDRSIGDLDPYDAIPWGIADTFNRILSDAIDQSSDSSNIEHIETYERSDSSAYSGQIADLRPMLAQIETLLEHDE